MCEECFLELREILAQALGPRDTKMNKLTQSPASQCAETDNISKNISEIYSMSDGNKCWGWGIKPEKRIQIVV